MTSVWCELALVDGRPRSSVLIDIVDGRFASIEMGIDPPPGDTVATFLPAADFSTRQPYADARRVLDAGATVALASNCNPGSSYTTSISFCIAIAGS